MPKNFYRLLIVISLFVSGCGAEPRLDGRDEGAWEQSIIKIENSLPAEEKVKFKAALEAIQADMRRKDPYGSRSPVFIQDVFDRLRNKTAKEVIAEAATLDPAPVAPASTTEASIEASAAATASESTAPAAP